MSSNLAAPLIFRQHLANASRRLRLPAPVQPAMRVRAHGKFFRLGSQKWYVKGLTYGPFAPNCEGEHLPPRQRLVSDFAQMAGLGANAIRVYHTPPRWLLDEAVAHGLRVFIDVPWEKHRCFFEDWSAQEDARQRIRKTARLLGSHPGTFAISVANEIPKDVVRFYGRERVGRFVDELIDIVKQESPECLATYTNYPSTEFLPLSRADFACFNVYLEDGEKLSAYLDRLQHLAGNLPLMLGEFGVDTIRKGEVEQERQLAEHVRKVFRHGLAGSFVFSYTDDWYTGGAQIEDWAFGITRRDRTPKPAAQTLAGLWRKAPRVQEDPLPKASVVVCSYNGSATLEECLRSLTRLNYPNYEVVLVDDGSTDNTREIAARYPKIQYIHQTNQGLSVARNVGAHAATGQVVVYTDSDCFADEDWLMYLMQSMVDQNVDAIGGPNVPPGSDNWRAKCVAASPGGPSHVMVDDRRAEHVPGCNMAFRRDRLLSIGGFDPRFRVAGDDVDICWRFLDAGLSIGYSPAALVWHKRRNTIRAYFKQQGGYGRSESMLHQKHPQRFNALGCARWKGIIYGEGAVGLPEVDPKVHYGQFGLGLFQTIYRKNEYSPWGYMGLLEWHAVTAFLLLLGIVWPWFAAGAAAMLGLSVAAAVRTMRSVTLPRNAPWWTRPVVFGLHFFQPIVRAYHRYKWRLTHKRIPHVPADDRLSVSHIRQRSGRRWDMYWKSTENRGREELLHALQEETPRTGFEANFDSCWHRWDALITGDAWHDITIHTATEELGWPNKFTRARVSLRFTTMAAVLATALLLFIALSAVMLNPWALAAGAAVLAAFGWRVHASQQRCLNGVSRLLWRAGHHAKLENVAVTGRRAVFAELNNPELAAVPAQ